MIVEWAADGDVTVVTHERKRGQLDDVVRVQEKDLDQTILQRDDMDLSGQIDYQMRHQTCAAVDAVPRQVAHEDVHRIVQSLFDVDHHYEKCV